MLISLSLIPIVKFSDIQTLAKPFKATAKIGVPFTIGEVFTVIGSKEVVDAGELKVLTVNSTRLEAIYPNLAENISAGAGEKLFIIRGNLKNPSSVELPIGASAFFGMRFFDGKGKGEFKFVANFDPRTHKYVQGSLKKGESVEFEVVLRVPAKFNSFRIGFYYRSTTKMAWYDFNPSLTKLGSVFSNDGLTLGDHATTSKDKVFDFDTFHMKVLGISETSAGNRKGTIVSIDVANAMLLPARWGWQYVTPELVMKDGSVVSAERDLIDKSTGKTWSGDLGVNASMTAQFPFHPAPGTIPGKFRLTSLLTKRTIEVNL